MCRAAVHSGFSVYPSEAACCAPQGPAPLASAPGAFPKGCANVTKSAQPCWVVDTYWPTRQCRQSRTLCAAGGWVCCTAFWQWQTNTPPLVCVAAGGIQNACNLKGCRSDKACHCSRAGMEGITVLLSNRHTARASDTRWLSCHVVEHAPHCTLGKSLYNCADTSSVCLPVQTLV